MTLSPETTEELIDLLELIAAGSTAKTLPSRATAILPHLRAVEDEPRACPHCGDTETVELDTTTMSGPEQSITVCAGCGAD